MQTCLYRMKIWKNTKILDDLLDSSTLTNNKTESEVVVLGSESINLNDFPNLKGIFRVGVGIDNVPMEQALERGINVRTTSPKTNEYIFEETADFTCHLILKMMYKDLGSIDSWEIKVRQTALKDKSLLIVGMGNIGRKVSDKMSQFMSIETFDILKNKISDLYEKLPIVDCVSLHFPLSEENKNFFDEDKLSKMKKGSVLINTARAGLVSEDSLYNEIKKGNMKAAFDVFWDKPYLGKLKQFYPDSFYMTPHVASKCRSYVENSFKDLKVFMKELNND